MDETLYDESTFVMGGFRAVAHFVASKWPITEKKVLEIILKEFKNQGRGKIFDVLLNKLDVNSKENIKKCLSVYRFHRPGIKLYKDAENFIKQFKDRSLYVVTDGNKRVQEDKVKVLGLDKLVKKVFITGRFGKGKSKPSPYCFMKICALEKIKPREAVHIADDSSKDFINLKPLGFHTIRIKRGRLAHIKLDRAHEAEFTFDSLKEAGQIIGRREQRYIFLLAGGIHKDKNGRWHSTFGEREGDKLGRTDNRLRVLASYELWKKDKDINIISSSGRGQYDKELPEGLTVAGILRQELVALGVPKHKIIEEIKSGTTWSQLKALEEMLYSGEVSGEVFVLSNGWHLPRVKAMIDYTPLKKKFKNFNVKFISAENVLLKNNGKHWSKFIENSEKSPSMKKRLALERGGVREIIAGTYLFK